MKLRPRFLSLTALFFLVVAVPSWLAVRSMADAIVRQWALRYAEKQVLYDKSRTLQPILREVALSRQLANSETLRRWARHPDAPGLERRAIEELESYRRNFADRSYFVGLAKNGRYYHDNARNEFAGRELRYVLDPKATKDAWFFDLIRQRRDLHINVNPDPDLGITKLWIDVLIRDGNEILGIAGTGLDLTSFIENVVEVREPGITSLFVDHAGAIQIHRNQALIDFGSISKSGSVQNTIALLFERPEDHRTVLAAMKALPDRPGSVETLNVQLKGRRHLAGIAYLPEIDWYEITLLDLDVLLPFSQFAGLMAVYGATLLGLLVLFNLAMRRYVISPLVRLEREIVSIEAGKESSLSPDAMDDGEIGRLTRRFAAMGQAVAEARRELERKVQERTAALERLTKIDPMTELLNRRGMLERLEAELQRSTRESTRMGILWIDIDLFKEINDRHGHDRGDAALRTIADMITRSVRPYDAVARWGGDEFLVMLPEVDQLSLDRLGERLRSEIERCTTLIDASGKVIPLRVSVGGHLRSGHEDLESLLMRGDRALFGAKTAHRNTYRSSFDLGTAD